MNEAEKLFIALEDGETETAAHLLEDNPALANATNQLGQTAFWIAACLGRTQIIEQMLSEPIRSILDYWKADNLLRDALQAAEAYNNREIIALLNPLFGVGVETEYAEEENEAPDQKHGLVRQLLDSIAMLFSKPALARYAAPISIAMALGFVILTTVFLLSRDNDVERMIAQGSSAPNVRDAVLSALESENSSRRKFDALSNELRSQGWDGIEISVSQNMAEGARLVRTCEVQLRRGQQTDNASIVVTGDLPKNIEVASTMDQLRVSLKSTKNRITALAINHCF